MEKYNSLERFLERDKKEPPKAYLTTAPTRLCIRHGIMERCKVLFTQNPMSFTNRLHLVRYRSYGNESDLVSTRKYSLYT